MLQISDLPDGPLGVKSRLREFARVTGRTLSEIAQAAGLNPSQLSQYDDDRLPGSPVLYRLDTFAGLSAGWLLTGQGSMFSHSAVGRDLFHRRKAKIVITRDPNSAVARELTEAGYVVVPNRVEALRETLKELGLEGEFVRALKMSNPASYEMYTNSGGDAEVINPGHAEGMVEFDLNDVDDSDLLEELRGEVFSLSVDVNHLDARVAELAELVRQVAQRLSVG